MARPDEARALLHAVEALKQQIEGLDDPGVPTLLFTLKRLREQAEGVDARAASEAERQEKGIGARPRYSRLT